MKHVDKLRGRLTETGHRFVRVDCIPPTSRPAGPINNMAAAARRDGVRVLQIDPVFANEPLQRIITTLARRNGGTVTSAGRDVVTFVLD